jgi:hypothetical protein
MAAKRPKSKPSNTKRKNSGSSPAPQKDDFFDCSRWRFGRGRGSIHRAVDESTCGHGHGVRPDSTLGPEAPKPPERFACQEMHDACCRSHKRHAPRAESCVCNTPQRDDDGRGPLTTTREEKRIGRNAHAGGSLHAFPGRAARSSRDQRNSFRIGHGRNAGNGGDSGPRRSDVRAGRKFGEI